MRTKVSRSLLLYLGILLCFDKSQTAYAEERYEVINAIYISRSEAKRAEQIMEGIFTVFRPKFWFNKQLRMRNCLRS